MGGAPHFSILKLWNMASTCLDLGWTPEQYYKAPKRETQAIITMNNARTRKQQIENQRQNNV